MRNFKAGDWWLTRDGNKAMIWSTRSEKQTEQEIKAGLNGRTLRCAFYEGGMASYPSDGYFIALSERRKGNQEHQNDLIKKCAPPPEFRRKKS